MRTCRNHMPTWQIYVDSDSIDSDLVSPSASEPKKEVPQEYAPMYDPSTSSIHLFDLPAEIRMQIYSYFLPYHERIFFQEVPRSQRNNCPNIADPKQPCFQVFSGAKDGSSSQLIAGTKWEPREKNETAPTTLTPAVQLHIFHVCKHMTSEARGVLYGSNTYEFTISGKSHFSATGSLNSDLIFGPFSAMELRLPILRNLRSIHLTVKVDEMRTHWVRKRHAARVAHFISVLKQHADDDAQKSLLENLTVHMKYVAGLPDPRPSWGWGRYYPGQKPSNPVAADPQIFMFGLEGITELKDIADVSVTGVPEWFARCLELCVSGKGGEVKPIEWPVLETRRRKPSGQGWNQTLTSTRKWYMPELNWEEFAERNGIELPDDVQRFWTDGVNDAEEVDEA